MDQPEEELQQIAAWLSEEGLAPDSPKEAQLCLLWRALQRTRGCLSSVTRDQDTQRSQHLAEMAEVRKSLEQIRVFTGHKDVLAQEIQDENDRLKDQLRQLISLQDAQISEVAKMLYQQGLTELIHSSPSEQVAYLLVERASLLETSEDPDNLTGAGKTTGPLGVETQVSTSNARQAEAAHLSGQSIGVERKCSRLERDLEEGSRRLAMAHGEIRRLTDELESAHLTQKAYEPELQAAQQEVEKLLKYEMVELGKAKELNDRLDLEIRALRSRVRSLDAEKTSLKQTVVSMQEEAEQLESALRRQQQQLLAARDQADQATERAKVVPLQREVERLESARREQRRQAERQLQAVQVQTDYASELARLQAAELSQSNATCRSLEEKLTAQTRRLSEKEETVVSLQREVQRLEAALQEQQQLLAVQVQTDRADELAKFGPQESGHDECEALKREICETLKCLDQERSKYHEMKEKHKAKLCRARHKLADEAAWRDEKMRSLERELSLSSHSLAKEKELVLSITAENEKLLAERARLLRQLSEEEHDKKDSDLTAALSRCRVDFLEMENRKLGNKILHMSNQLAALERAQQNTQPLHFAEELKKIYNPPQVVPSLSGQTPSVMMPKPSENHPSLDDSQSSHTKQTDATSPPHCFMSSAPSRPAEMGYLNLTSAQRRSDCPAPPAALSSSESLCS